MNCKPGDVATVVRLPGQEELIGALCTVIEDGGSYTYQLTGISMPGWIVEFAREVNWGNPSPEWGKPMNFGWLPDAWLRPIGDSDGEDEMLRIAGKPITHEISA